MVYNIRVMSIESKLVRSALIEATQHNIELEIYQIREAPISQHKDGANKIRSGVGAISIFVGMPVLDPFDLEETQYKSVTDRVMYNPENNAIFHRLYDSNSGKYSKTVPGTSEDWITYGLSITREFGRVSNPERKPELRLLKPNEELVLGNY